jgi:hypothetical protein
MTARPTPAPLRATPLTDGKACFIRSGSEVVSADFARQLEHELQDATAAATGAKEMTDLLEAYLNEPSIDGRPCRQDMRGQLRAALARYQRTATTAGEGEPFFSPHSCLRMKPTAPLAPREPKP